MKALLETLMLAKADEETPEQKLALIQAVRREFHAGLAMQGMLAGRGAFPGPQMLAQYAEGAVDAADALIAKLDAPQA